jgi:hypothetical protein
VNIPESVIAVLAAAGLAWFTTMTVMRGRVEEWKKSIDQELVRIAQRLAKIEVKTNSSDLDLIKQRLTRLNRDLIEEKAFWRIFRHDTYTKAVHEFQLALYNLEKRCEILEREFGK